MYFVNDIADAQVIRAMAANGVKLIALRCAGYNNVDLNAAQENGIKVVRVPAYSPYAVAEHTVALMLALNRRIPRQPGARATAIFSERIAGIRYARQNGGNYRHR